MSDAPSTDLLTRYVLENPYPLAALLGAVAIGLLWVGLREGRGRPLQGAGITGLLAIAIVITASVVTTSGEHGERVTREFVDRVVANDTAGALAMVSPAVAVTVGSPRNPGRDYAFFKSRLEFLAQRYPISNNRITSLRGYSESSDIAIVHLSCSTQVDAGYGPVPSRWIVRVERGDDSQWIITRMTAVSIASRTPSDSLW